MTLINELIDIPEQVQQGDFVLNLSAGLEGEAAERTLAEYVITPQLADCFENALSFIKSTVEDTNNRSKGAYLHGSFGSGKSHFMAVLHLLLQGHTSARALTELAASVTKHDDWMQQHNILLVPYHMIGASSVEAGVLGGYAKYIAKHYPDAPVPGFYQSDRLFHDAGRLRKSFGDDAFFNQLNEAVGGNESADEGWGEMASGWDAAGFDAVINGSGGDHDRARLVGDLITAFFSTVQDMTASDGKGFIAFDDGLTIMTQHAKDLGFDAVILFLDELILWLASNLSNPDFIAREIQKVVKLVESSSPRALPLASLIARQRDLKDFIGDNIQGMGAEQAALSDALKHWEGRFHTIRLADGNLPSIAEKRVLAPVSDAARLQIDQAFEKTAAIRRETFEILLTKNGDKQQFRKLYPFSPAAIDALVALSSALQRERTALKVMMLLLVKHRESLALGSIIPVGDLYDVIADEAVPFSEGMRQHFDTAQRLLKQKLIPLLEAEHSLSHDALADSTIDDPRANAYRNDLRLLKTLLLSALVPEVECFQQLSANKIAALNHGTIKSPIPNGEGKIVLSKFGKWASQVGEIRINDEGNTLIISLQLLGVDTQAILDAAASNDNQGNRSRLIKELVCEELQITLDADLFQQHKMEWRGSNRTVEVSFLNIREVQDNSNFVARDDEWRVLIDYPFDTGTHTPSDDQSKINQYIESGGQGRTLCWLPSFLSEQMQQRLGTLVRLETILRNDDSFSQYTSHLSPQDKPSARQLLDNQRSQLREQIRRVLLAAYGVSAAEPDTLQYEDTVEHLCSLEPGFAPNLPIGSTLKQAFEQLLSQALTHQFPAHPNFPELVNSAQVGKVYTEMCKAMLQDDGRIGVETAMRTTLRNVAQPMDLGVMHESYFIFSENWPNKLNRALANKGADQISVQILRECINNDQPIGLHRELENLLILVFAEHGKYAFVERGRPVNDASHKNLQDDWTLVKEDLADSKTWQTATANASAVFGVTSSPHLTGTNQQHLVHAVNKEIKDYHGAMQQLESRLQQAYATLAIDENNTSANRLANARLAVRLADQLLSLDGVKHIDALASIELATDAQALGISIKQSAAVAQALDAFAWPLIDSAVTASGEPGEHIRHRVIDALQLDERVQSLPPVLKQATSDCATLLTAPKPTSAPLPLTSAPPLSGNTQGATSGATSNIGGRSIAVNKSRSGVSTAEAVSLLNEASTELKALNADKVDIEIVIRSEQPEA